MRKEEAAHVGAVALDLAGKGAQPVLNIGSSTAHFRSVEQPHIHAEIFGPLQRAGVRVIHSDLKEADGVDIAGDIFDPAVQRRLGSLHPRLLLACNLMEHLEPKARATLPDAFDRILAPGGFILITVPHSYPLHFDPIDTYYRPSPTELRALFPAYRAVEARVIESSSYLPELRSLAPRAKLRLAARALVPFYRPMQWLGLVHRFLWIARPYKVSCVVLQKPGA